MKTIQINNYPFSYIDDGVGSPVIFIHGSISDYRTWENQMEPFAKQFHVIAYSRRYHYPNNSVEDYSDYTYPQHAKDLAAFIKALDVGTVNLIGSSYGAYVALLTAINNPDLVKTLVLGEPPVIPLLVSNVDNPLQALLLLVRDFSTGKSFLKFGTKAMNPAKKQLRKGNIKEGIRLFANGVLGEGGYEQLPEDAKVSMMDNATALKAEMLGPGFPDEFPKKEAMKLPVTTLLAYGEKSPKFFHSISDKLFNLLPNGQQVVIPDASHDMHGENPEAYNEKVLEFLLKHN
jgi:pimeloyl-ACP methyl ester carboxylesterase